MKISDANNFVEPSDTNNLDYYEEYIRHISSRNTALYHLIYNVAGADNGVEQTTLFYEDKDTYIAFEDGSYLNIER